MAELAALDSAAHAELHSIQRRTPWGHVAAVALLLTGLNALKPVHLDDPFFLLYASEFAAHPLNPYGFSFGSPEVAPANELLLPPVLPYWLAAGMWLFGDEPVLLKCWLLPFAVLLAWAAQCLAGRFAPSLRIPLLWLSVLSPTILPGFNFMLEVPVFALGLAGLALAMRSVERGSCSLALLAGVLAGLAVQTKYTGLVHSAALVVWCVLQRRPAYGLAAAVLALTLAAGWECFLGFTQGESHFLVQLGQRHERFVIRCLHLVLPLLFQMAGLAPAVALLGLRAQGWAKTGLLATALTMLAGFAALALVPAQAPLIPGESGKPILALTTGIYVLLAVPVWWGLGGVCVGLARRARGLRGPERLVDFFLLAWLTLELAGYFTLSPFPAARRVAGVLLVLTFMVGRLAHRRGLALRAVRRFAAAGVALALLYFGIDLLDARAARAAAHAVACVPHSPAEEGEFWHLSRWGFSYYADREGLRPLQLNRQMPRPGDLLAVFDSLPKNMASHPELGLELIDTVVVGDGFPLKVTTGYYSGRRPMENQRYERVRVLIYRITSVREPS